MDEQNELNDLKQLMERQQKTLTETMSAMELKATALQEKLDRRAELSSANAEAGVKKIALEYKVVELEIDCKLPPGFELPKTPPSANLGKTFGFSVRSDEVGKGSVDPLKNKNEGAFKFAVPDDQAVMEEIKEKARQRHREFEENKLKELGEEGWTLRGVDAIMTPVSSITKSYTKLYYFSRPL